MKDTSNLFIVLCAPSASGKTTYAQSLVAANPGLSILSPDNLRFELTGDMSDQSRNAFIFNTLLPIRINGCHSRVLGCVLDATSTTRKARKLLVEYAKVAGYTRIECHVIKVDEATCQARNAARERQVPEFVISRQFTQWQEPELAEGFDAVVYPFVPHTYPIDTLVKLKPMTARSEVAWTRNLDQEKVYKVRARYHQKIGLEGMSLDDSWDASLFDEIVVDKTPQAVET